VFVANGDSKSVSVLDARGNRVARTIAMGGRPAAIAVDEQAGRVLVANQGADNVSVIDERP